MSALLFQSSHSHFDLSNPLRTHATPFSCTQSAEMFSGWDYSDSRSAKHPYSASASASDTVGHGLKRTKSSTDLDNLYPRAALPSSSPAEPQYVPRSANGMRAIIHVEQEEHCAHAVYPSLRTSSPLSPNPRILPPRASFPRSKNQPDLYKLAITTRMRSSPEGQQILQFGARAAIQYHEATLKRQSMTRLMNSQLWEATLELERIVQSQQRESRPRRSFDSGNSWMVIPLEESNWEMVDCAA